MHAICVDRFNFDWLKLTFGVTLAGRGIVPGYDVVGWWESAIMWIDGVHWKMNLKEVLVCCWILARATSVACSTCCVSGVDNIGRDYAARCMVHILYMVSAHVGAQPNPKSWRIKFKMIMQVSDTEHPSNIVWRCTAPCDVSRILFRITPIRCDFDEVPGTGTA